MNYEQTTSGDIKKEIGAIMVLIGANVSKYDDSDFTLLANHMKKDFHDFEFGSLTKAIQLGMKGLLDREIEQNKRVSPLYLSNIMLSYKRKRFVPVNHISNRKELPRPEMSKEDFERFNFEKLKEFFERKQEPFLINYKGALRHAEREGLINLDDDEKEMFMENVKAELEELIQMDVKRQFKDDTGTIHSFVDMTIKKAKKRAEIVLNSPKELKNECRKRILINYLKNNTQ